MVTITQKSTCGGYTASCRLDTTTYEAMIALINLGGYGSVGDFVKAAVLTKCQDMSRGIGDIFADRQLDIETNPTTKAGKLANEGFPLFTASTDF